MLRRLPREEYTVGWVCALPVELAAAAEMLDDEHDTPPRDARHAHDTNTYTCGNIGEHNVVIACLPHGRTGTNSAAAVASQMQTAFTSIRFGLMIGIGGGVPSEDTDIRLGDVVVGTPHRTHGGVIQYDLGKVIPTGFERTGFLNAPPNFLLTAITTLQARLMRGKAIMPKYVCRFKTLTGFERHLASPDMLFHQGYSHHGGKSCSDCDKAYLVNRKMRLQEVVVHYGTIASGNQVIRSATERDRLSDQLGGVLCFEMEAAGLVNSFPCLVVRGICDYADSHKNDDWQTYAAATAAAYTKELLSVVPVADAISTGRTGEAINDRDGDYPVCNGTIIPCELTLIGRILQSSSSTSSVSAYVTTSNSRGSDHSTIK
jgi:nucleoside phosphorylase